jgi:hypothetical protein
MRRLAVNSDGHDHFVHRSVVRAHASVSGHLHREAILGRGGNRERYDGEKNKDECLHDLKM